MAGEGIRPPEGQANMRLITTETIHACGFAISNADTNRCRSSVVAFVFGSYSLALRAW